MQRLTHIPHHVMLSASVLALAYALMEKPSQCLEILEEGEILLASSEDPIVHQSWCLYCADTLQLLGKHEEAVKKARKAGVGSSVDFSLATIVGKYARWTAILGHQVDSIQAGNILNQLMMQRASYDRLDQVEILNAKIWFDFTNGCGSNVGREWTQRELGTMPPGVAVLLQRLGMLDFTAGQM